VSTPLFRSAPVVTHTIRQQGAFRCLSMFLVDTMALQRFFRCQRRNQGFPDATR